MTGLQISLLVIGIVFLVGSFFVSEKLSSSDVQEIQKLGEKEIKVLLEKEMKAAESKLEEMAKDKIDEKIESFAVETDKELNNKIMSISEYSDTVLDSMNKSHNEIMFMYEMLNEKQQKVTDLTKELGLMQSAVTQMEASIDDKIEQVEAMSQKAVVQSGNKTLKDATSEAIRDWCCHPADTFYIIGSTVGPHPYPDMWPGCRVSSPRKSSGSCRKRWGATIPTT